MGREGVKVEDRLTTRDLLGLASPTPGCSCDTCRAIRAARHKLARAKSHPDALTALRNADAYLADPAGDPVDAINFARAEIARVLP
jgi:hypothetical protein